MARRKATITIDQRKVDEAQALTGARSMSDTVDVALDRLIRAERTRRDVEAYLRAPLGDDELTITDVPMGPLDLGDDDMDYDALYSEGGS